MVRRRTIEEPTSRLAIWARRVALFSLAATLIAVIIVRSGALEIVPALSTLAGALVLAVLAILLAFGAALSIWFEGVGGAREAATAFFIGCALIAYPAFLGIKGYRLPAIYDITTDPIDPPRFDAIARLRPRDANPITYQGLYTAALQHAAYSDIEPDVTDSTPREAYDAAMKVIIKRKWRIVDARPPQGGGPQLVEAQPRPARGQPPPAPPPRDGYIEAVARTPILGFRDDLVVRIRPTGDGARIDVRSASRYGRHDLGTNASRVRNLLGDIDDVLAAPHKPTPSPPPAPANKNQPAKPASARR
ncbi:MAG TPA: DUF1499 domain-containing protein [Xanthobacteraceae bacterium]|nr:DUF1499 domain-containing protein [Xanthobacteraceae bacterium]